MNFYERNLTHKVEYPGITMAAALDELFAEQERIIEQPREYVLREIPSPRELEKLTALPFEVSITKLEDGRLVLSTGTEEEASQYFEIDGKNQDLVAVRLMKLPLSFHTHPPEGEQTFNRPSLHDLSLLFRSSTEVMVIGTSESLITITLKDKSAAHAALARLSKRIEEIGPKKFQNVEETLIREFLHDHQDVFSIEYFDWDSEEALAEIQQQFSQMSPNEVL